MINFNLNGKDVETKAHPSMRLLDVLRNEFKLTGPKEGCGEGECGACSVLVDGKLINSCLVAVGSIDGHRVVTIEGYAENGERFDIISHAFADTGAVQCGFCTPGMVLATENLLEENPNPSEDEIREGLSGNLCRCTGYEKIIEAVKIVAEEERQDQRELSQAKEE